MLELPSQISALLFILRQLLDILLLIIDPELLNLPPQNRRNHNERHKSIQRVVRRLRNPLLPLLFA